MRVAMDDGTTSSREKQVAVDRGRGEEGDLFQTPKAKYYDGIEYVS